MSEVLACVPRVAMASDAANLATFLGGVFRPAVGRWAELLLAGAHPTTGLSDFALIEDPTSGRILSTLCLIPQTWRWGDASLRVAQVELVATAEAYRGKGLLRELMRWVEERQSRDGTVLSCVQGSPEVYRHFGYEDAIPLKGGVRIGVERLPETVPAPWRACGSADLPSLARLFDQSVAPLELHAVRDLALWCYQEHQPANAEHAYRTWLRDEAGDVTAYVRTRRIPKQGALVVKELVAGDDVALAGAFACVRAAALESSCGEVAFQLPPGDPILEQLLARGGTVVPRAAWQVRIPDRSRLNRTVSADASPFPPARAFVHEAY